MKIKLAYPGKDDQGRAAVYHVGVDALVFGDWAAYETPHRSKGEWSVGHVPSGLCLSRDLSRDEAVHVAIRVAQFNPQLPDVKPELALPGRKVAGAFMSADERTMIEAALGEVLGGVAWYP